SADMHSAIVAAICALKGPTHGGANEAAMRMIEGFGSVERLREGVRRRLDEKQTLFGFGHPVYTTIDPRATILKGLVERVSHADVLCSRRAADARRCREPDEVPARRIAAPAALVQHPLRHAHRPAARAASGHRAAGRAGRPCTALPDGADRPGGERGAGDRHPGGGAGDLQPLAPDPALPRAAARGGDRYPLAHLLQV